MRLLKHEFLTLKDVELFNRWETIVIASRKTPHYDIVKVCVSLGKHLDRDDPVEMACHDTIVKHSLTLESQWAQVAALMDGYHPRGNEVATYTKEVFKDEMEKAIIHKGWFKTLQNTDLAMTLLGNIFSKIQRKKIKKGSITLVEVQNLYLAFETNRSYLNAYQEMKGLITNDEMEHFMASNEKRLQQKIEQSQKVVYDRLVNNYETRLKNLEFKNDARESTP